MGAQPCVLLYKNMRSEQVEFGIDGSGGQGLSTSSVPAQTSLSAAFVVWYFLRSIWKHVVCNSKKNVTEIDVLPLSPTAHQDMGRPQPHTQPRARCAAEYMLSPQHSTESDISMA